MSFANSAHDVHLNEPNGHILVAQLYDANGELKEAEIDLDDYIGNDDGHFQWGAEGFSGSAEEITFSFEGEANAPVLRALLRDQDGNYEPRDINLGERIRNSNGEFEFV